MLQGQAFCPPYAATFTTAAECGAAILKGVQAAEALGIELSKHGINPGKDGASESAMLTSKLHGPGCGAEVLPSHCAAHGCTCCKAALHMLVATLVV